MTIRERWEKLEPRERKLLGTLGTILGVFGFLFVPIYIVSGVAARRASNQELSELVDQIYDSRVAVGERRAKHDALLARYAKQAPPLAGFLDEAARANSIAAAESQDRAEVPHGKHYSERLTVVKMHKIGMLNLAKMLEKIEQSGYPVAVTRLDLKPRSGEPDSYEVELGVSAFDRKAEAPAASPSASASATAAPAPERVP